MRTRPEKPDEKKPDQEPRDPAGKNFAKERPPAKTNEELEQRGQKGNGARISVIEAELDKVQQETAATETKQRSKRTSAVMQGYIERGRSAAEKRVTFADGTGGSSNGSSSSASGPRPKRQSIAAASVAQEPPKFDVRTWAETRMSKGPPESTADAMLLMIDGASD